MSTDTLDSLTPAQLANVFRIEILEMYFGASVKRGDPEPCWRFLSTENHCSFLANFAEDVNALLPFLEHHNNFRIDRLRKPSTYCVYIEREHPTGGWTYVKAEDASLARAIATVLIRAKRANK